MKGSRPTSLTEPGGIFGFSFAMQGRHTHTHMHAHTQSSFPGFLGRCFLHSRSTMRLPDLAPLLLVGGVALAAPSRLAPRRFGMPLHRGPLSAKSQTLPRPAGKRPKGKGAALREVSGRTSVSRCLAAILHQLGPSACSPQGWGHCYVWIHERSWAIPALARWCSAAQLLSCIECQQIKTQNKKVVTDTTGAFCLVLPLSVWQGEVTGEDWVDLHF